MCDQRDGIRAGNRGQVGAARGWRDVGGVAARLVFSKVITMTVPELLSLTLEFFSSISRTSIGPLRWCSLRIQESSFAGAPGWARGWILSNACLALPVVVMPVRVTLGKGAAGGDSTFGAGRGRRPKRFRSEIRWYGFVAGVLLAEAVVYTNKLLMTQVAATRGQIRIAALLLFTLTVWNWRRGGSHAAPPHPSMAQARRGDPCAPALLAPKRLA